MVETSAGNVSKELTQKVSPPELIIQYASQDWDGNSPVEMKFRLQRCCRRGHRDAAPELRPEYGRSVCQRQVAARPLRNWTECSVEPAEGVGSGHSV